MDHPYRVFVNYSSHDFPYAARVVERLRELGLAPRWDQLLPNGMQIAEEIATEIGYAHLFVPLLTKSATTAWVRQEIGIAIGKDIPFLPIAIGTLPDGMLSGLNALRLASVDDIERELSEERIDQAIEAKKNSLPKCWGRADIYVEFFENRTQMLAEYARDVFQRSKRDDNENGERCRVRQRGELSVFSLPDHADGSFLELVYEGERQRQKNQMEERLALGECAEDSGCRLIIDPDRHRDQHKSKSTRLRLETLRDFLTKLLKVPCLSEKDVCIAIGPSDPPMNQLLVGDWFFAESHSRREGVGWQHTVLTQHALTVLDKMFAFDKELERLPHYYGHDAIDELNRQIGLE